MALRVGSAYLDVLPRLGRTFDGDVERAVSSPMDRAGSKAGGILGGAIGRAVTLAVSAVAVKKAYDFVKGAVDNARESIEVSKQTEAVIRSTGGAANVTADHVDKLATAISNKTAMDDEAIASSENLLLTFKDVRNEVGAGNDIFDQASAVIADMSVALKTDLKGASIQVGKALNDPIQGITALTRSGVTFTQQQKDQIKTLVESGDKLGAQKIILAELRTEFGGSAEAVATSSGRLSVVWGNLTEDLGKRLVPAIDAAAGFLADRLPGAADVAFAGLDHLSGMVGDLAGDIGSFFTALRTGLSEDEGTAIENAAIALRGMGDAVIEKVTPALEGADPLLERLADAVSRNRDVLEPAGVALSTFVAGLIALHNASAGVSAVGTIIDALGPTLGAALAAVGGSAAIVVAAIAAVVAAFAFAYIKIKPFHDAVDAVGRAIRDGLVAAFDVVAPLVVGFGEKIAGAASAIADTVGSWISSAGDAFRGITSALSPLAQWFNDNVVSTFSAGAEFFAALFDRLRRIIEPAVQVIISILQTLLPIVVGVFSALIDIIGPILSTIATLFADFVAVAMPVLSIAFDALRLVVETAFGAIRAVIEITLGIIRGVFEVMSGILRGDFSAIWEGLVDLVTTPLNAVWTFVDGFFGNLLDFMGGLPGKMAAAGSAMWDWLSDSLRGAVNIVVGLINGLIDLINSFQIHIHIVMPSEIPNINFDWSGLGLPHVPELRDKGGATFPGESYLIGSGLVELFTPGRGHVTPQNELVAALEGAAATTGRGGHTFQLTSGDVIVNKPEDVETGFARLELMAALP